MGQKLRIFRDGLLVVGSPHLTLAIPCCSIGRIPSIQTGNREVAVDAAPVALQSSGDEWLETLSKQGILLDSAGLASCLLVLITFTLFPSVSAFSVLPHFLPHGLPSLTVTPRLLRGCSSSSALPYPLSLSLSLSVSFSLSPWATQGSEIRPTPPFLFLSFLLSSFFYALPVVNEDSKGLQIGKWNIFQFVMWSFHSSNM